jgi:uncharacterized membrane protein
MPFHIGYLELILMIPMFLVSVAVYFLPTILASIRHRPNTMTIFLINLLLGWTALGWIAAMVLVFIETKNIIPATESALDTARQRYDKGEISQTEFEEIKKTIA